MSAYVRRGRYGVKHERRRKKAGYDDCFAVRANIGSLDEVDKTPVELIDSQQCSPGLDPKGFDEDTRIMHGVKRRDGRATKGRIFYITAGGEVIAFVAFHVPPSPGPLIIENVVLHARFAGSRRAIARVRRVLLHAVLEASEACGRGGEKLAWATASREKSQQIAAQFGFAVAVRPSNTDCELTYYLERTFPAVN
jgi:hypothetical protein